jgi:hypothetical protein
VCCWRLGFEETQLEEDEEDDDDDGMSMGSLGWWSSSEIWELK